MKKVILFLVLCCTMPIVFGQEMSERTLVVRQGDNLWDLSQREYGSPLMWWNFLNNNSNLHPYIDSMDGQWYCLIRTGDTLHTGDYYDAGNHPRSNKIDFVQPKESIGNPDRIALWLILSLIAIVVLVYIILRIKRENKANPVTAGPAMIVSGVNDNSINSIVAGRHPGARIKRIQKGRLYGKGIPYYNFRKISLSRLINNAFGKIFNGETGYQAVIVTPDGREMIVQTLAGCGNEIKMNGQFMTGLTFVPDEAQSDVLNTTESTTSPVVDNKAEAAKQPVDNETEIVMMEVAEMAGKFFSTQTAHKATTRFERRADGSIVIESILETFDPGRKKPEVKK